MSGSADGNLAAFDEINTGLTGFDMDIAATAKNCFHLAVDDFDAHGAFDGDGIAFDRSDRIPREIISERERSRAKKRAEK